MKFSEALMLGSTLPCVRKKWVKWVEGRNFEAGCLLTNTAIVMGVKEEELSKTWPFVDTLVMSKIKEFWPWVTRDLISCIVGRFDMGESTEKIISFVKKSEDFHENNSSSIHHDDVADESATHSTVGECQPA